MTKINYLMRQPTQEELEYGCFWEWDIIANRKFTSYWWHPRNHRDNVIIQHESQVDQAILLINLGLSKEEIEEILRQ